MNKIIKHNRIKWPNYKIKYLNLYLSFSFSIFIFSHCYPLLINILIYIILDLFDEMYI